MQKIKWTIAVMSVLLATAARGQKAVQGVRFRHCENRKDLPADFYKNKFLIVDFWATWCGPCIGSFPALGRLQHQYRQNANVVFACMSAERAGLIDSFFRRHPTTLPGVLHLVDDGGASWQYFGINTIPALLVINPAGKIVFSGHVEALASAMDKLLKGVNLYKPPVQESAVALPAEKIKEVAAVMITTGPAVAGNGGSRFKANESRSEVEQEINGETIQDVVEDMGNTTSARVIVNDTARANQVINIHYRQAANDFPEFDNGIFPYQYQNHMLHVLESVYGFRSAWVTEMGPGWQIAVTDSKKLKAAATLSTHGSYSSTINGKIKTINLVNKTLADIAAMAENYERMPYRADSTVRDGYDMELEFSSAEALGRSLSRYGLGLERIENYAARKLKMTFYDKAGVK